MALSTIARQTSRTLASSPLALRAGLGIVLAAIIGVGALAASGVASITATPPSGQVQLTRAAFTSVVTTGQMLDEPVVVRFNTPMDRTSVESALRIEPRRDVDLAWDSSSRTLTITPAQSWLPDTLHSVTVDPGALAESGRPLAKPAHSAFLTRTATEGRIEATRPRGDRVAIGTAFTITFSRPVTTESVAGALTSDPVMDGTLVPTAWQPDGTSFTFTPRKALPVNTPFTLSLNGVQAVDGEELAPFSMAVKTVVAPRVKSIRPAAGSTGAARSSKISVRFSQPMDEATTAAALTVRANGKAVKGKVSFKNDGKTLVFKPKKRLPYGAKVSVTVGLGATSITGTPISKKFTLKFRVERRPSPVSSTSATTRIGTGGSGGGGSWAAVERYYLGLMNCTRTGGWVTSSGSCSSPGGRNVAPLKLDSGISSRVARPYARLLATTGQCSHFLDGSPNDRLRRAGYTSSRWGENIGCRSGDPYAAVLGTHLFYQSERSYNGGHYRNLMDSGFDRVGIGVWVSGGRVRLVIDFYHP